MANNDPEEIYKVRKALLNILKLFEDQKNQKLSSEWKTLIKLHLLGTVPTTQWRNYDPSVDQLAVGLPILVKRSDGQIKWAIIGFLEDTGCTCIIDEELRTKRISLEKVLIPLEIPSEETSIIDTKSPISRQDLTSFIERSLKNRYQKIEYLIKLLDEVTPLELKENEKKFLTNNFSLIWGATFPQNTIFPKVHSDYPERAHRGILPLGDSVSSAFVKKKNLPTMQQWLKDRELDVTVLTISSAYYLQFLSFLNRWHQEF